MSALIVGSTVFPGGGSQVFKPHTVSKKQAEKPTTIATGTTIVLLLMAWVEGCDIALLGSVEWFWMMEPPFGIPGYGIWTKGNLGIAQGVMTNAGGVFWGIAADRGWMNRREMLCIAAFLQAVCTISLALVDSVPPMWPIRILNGFFLAALRPLSNGIVADQVSESRQGAYFGYMQGTWIIGMQLTFYFLVPRVNVAYDLGPLGRHWGWRFGLVGVSCVALLASVGAMFIMSKVPQHELTEEEKNQSAGQTIATELSDVRTFFKYPSFVLMIIQGMFGSIPWIVMGNNTMYAKLCGLSSEEVATVGLTGFLGVLGGLIGGIVSDILYRTKIGPAARGLTGTLSVAGGILCFYMLYRGIPPAEFTAAKFAIIMIIFNLWAQWPQPGCNFPILAQIVVEEKRNKVFCWEMAVENSMATIMGTNLPPIVLNLLGYNFDKIDKYPDLVKADQLGQAQAWSTVGPWSICMLVYATLMWAFPRDLERLEAERAAEGPNTQLTAV